MSKGITAWEKVEIARNPKRKTSLDYINSIFDDFIELHGDRAFKDDKAIGLIIGTIPKYDEYDYLDYKCPKRGCITELIVTSKVRSNGIGQALMDKLQDYFKEVGCEYVIVDIFAYNDSAMKFYFKKGFHPRMVTGIKKI